MPVIKPISDLRNKANEISDLAHKLNETIFITKNGEGDMVVMSMARYAQFQLKLDLFGKLAAAQSQIASGDKGRTLKQVMTDIRKRLLSPRKHAVKLLRIAEDDLAEIIAFIAEDNVAAAEKLLIRLKSGLPGFRTTPLSAESPLKRNWPVWLPLSCR